MKAAIISQGSKSSAMLVEAMKKYFSKVDALDIGKIEVNLSKQSEVLYEGNPIGNYDCIYAKGSFKYEQLLRSLTMSLGTKTYLPIEANAFSVAHDKILTQLHIQKSKIPMPTTYLSSSIDSARGILKKLNYPIIMKFPRGTHGKGVMFADSFASASSILDALHSLKQPFLIQEYIETGGVDIRLIIVGEKVVAGMKRKAELGEKRANIHAGGSGEAYLPDAYMKKIAVKAAKAIGAEICAIDLLESVKGPVVIEVNASPGLQGITEIGSVDVADHIAKFLFEKAKEKKSSKQTDKAKEIMKEVDFAGGQEIITNLDFRGNRILLPDLATKITGLKEENEVTMRAKKGEIVIKKF